MTLRLDFDGITDRTTMAQASTLVPVTKMKKSTSVDACAIIGASGDARYRGGLCCKHYILYKKIVIWHTFINLTKLLRNVCQIKLNLQIFIQISQIKY